MHRKLFRGEGIVIFRKDWGEADRIVTIYSKEYGKMRFVAKGVRKPKSRKRGHIEIFSRLKFSGVETKGMPILTEAELLDNFFEIRKDLRKSSVAYYFCEVLGKLTRDEEANEEFYDWFIDYLNLLETSKSLGDLRRDFVSGTLQIFGYWPRGKEMDNPDDFLEKVMERGVNSVRVGKKVLS